MEEELEETSLRHRSGATRHHQHHQRRRAKKPPPPTTTNYDDVFGGPPRHAVPFSGVPDDYAEVFGGVTASCSIPFLDLPMAQMDGWDCASGESVNGVDYGEIFGRCDFADFAVPYEELFGRGRRDEGDIDMHFVSSNGRSSVKSRSGPQTIDPSEFIQEFSIEDSIPYLEDGNFSVASDEIPKEYNTSYSKSSRTKAKELLHTTASVPQPQTGFTFVVEPDKPLPGNLPFVNEDTATHENSVKSNPVSAVNIQSISREEPVSCEVPFMSASGINLQTQSANLPPPARPAPPKFLRNEGQKVNTFAKTDSISNFSIGAEQPQPSQQEKPKPFLKSDSLPLNFDFVPSLKLDKREKPKLKKPITFSKSESLPPGFGSELDAMKEAMEFAQARLKTAKELHEQRREGKITELPLKKRHVKEECMEGSEGAKPRVLHSVSKGREFTKVQGGETMATHGNHELEKSGKWISDEEFHELTSIGATKEREIKVGITGFEPLMVANRESVKINGMPPPEVGVTEKLNEDTKDTENIEVVQEIKFGEDLKKEEEITIGSYETLNGSQESTIEQVPDIIQDDLKLEKERGKDKTEALTEDAIGIQNMEEIENTGEVEAETGDGKGFQMEVRTETEEVDMERNEVELELEREKLQKSEAETIGEMMRGELEKEEQREKEIKEEEEKERGYQLEEQKEMACKLEEEEELRLLMEKEREEKERMEREKMLAEEKERLEREKRKFEELERERLVKEQEEKQRKLVEERERERKLEEERQEEKMREKEMMRKLEEEKERERKLTEEIEKERERVRKLEEERELERQRVRKLEEEKEREREMARKLQEEKEKERKLEEEIKKERERVRKLEEERELERERVRKLEEERELERERFRKLEEEREQERERVRKLEEEREKAMIEKEMEWKERERIEKEREQKERERIEKEREQKERERIEKEREQKERERIEKEREQEEREKKLEEEKEKQRMMEKEKEEREKLRRMENEREEKEMAMRLETEMRRIERERAEERERMTKLQGERAKERKTEARKSDEERERENRMKERERRTEGRKSDEEREKAQGRKSDEERERERERRARKEREMEREREREKEEREREREKDRLAMEQATKERAERIALERITAARLRAVESREKEETSNRSGAEGFEKKRQKGEEDKKEREGERNAREARMRVERAAVERATAEARERAIERAKAEAERDRLERFKSLNKISSQDHPQEGHFKRTQSDSALSQGESALRHKARLERQQRTAERAAKALAEKNRRDIMAQREQAERDRIADHLDAEVKRWSSGKEGNLRALLSTLQYILGQNSGWQPIHLTEVITAADVKKAYRKATLYVHPDKLQQRGASIQQKYICEKVFDLLKEAWNKFNSEER